MTAANLEIRLKLNGFHNFSTLTKSKGNFIIRKGFFYEMGYSAKQMAEDLNAKFPGHIEIVKTWRKFVPFRGGDSVAKSSHFGVEFKFTE